MTGASSMLGGLDFDGLEEKTYRKVTPGFDYGSLLPSRGFDEAFSPQRSSYGGHAKSFSPSFGSAGTLSSTPKPTKPEDVIKLEKILTTAYEQSVDVTCIRALPTTRKAVKEVSFQIGDGISKVWVFKADPQQTLRELKIYHVIHGQDIPTARPIGFTPDASVDEYPFEVAILGGVVEHAGDPYDKLLANLQLRPDKMFETADRIAKMIATYQIRLSHAEQQFEELGVDLRPVSPGQELSDRLFAALDISYKQGLGLVGACSDLYHRQYHPPLVSHGDLHTGQIVTKQSLFKFSPITSMKEFGVIDWGSIGYDAPFGDLASFWVHHKRVADNILAGRGEQYEYTMVDLLGRYWEHLRAEATRVGWGEDVPEEPDLKSALIQSALWNLYEMFDPVRDDPQDIADKSTRHHKAMGQQLSKLHFMGLRTEAEAVQRELKQLLDAKGITV